jgi:hypothetical protein
VAGFLRKLPLAKRKRAPPPPADELKLEDKSVLKDSNKDFVIERLGDESDAGNWKIARIMMGSQSIMAPPARGIGSRP